MSVAVVWTALQVACQGLLCVAALLSLLHLLRSAYKTLRAKRRRRTVAQPSSTERLQEERYTADQEEARASLQTSYDSQVREYEERVLEPRREQKRKEVEEKYERFTGPAFKGRGDTLDPEGLKRVSPSEEGGREAAELRTLPDPPTSPPEPRNLRQRKTAPPKPELPEEPAEGSSDCVVVRLSLPRGTSVSRRFLASHPTQVLFDYMHVSGYRPALYTLALPYPRTLLQPSPDRSLADEGLRGRVTLHVEQREEEDEE